MKTNSVNEDQELSGGSAESPHSVQEDEKYGYCYACCEPILLGEYHPCARPDNCPDGECPIGSTMVGWPHPSDMETCSSRRPADTFHVIDFIREEMDERDWSIWTLVRHMSDDQSDEALGRIKLALELLELREPDMLIGEEIAAGLSRAFGTGQEIWLNLDRAWRDSQRASVGSGDNNVTKE